MKLIRNRKMLQAKRRRYSHLMQSFRATIKEGAKEMATRDAMIDWLAEHCVYLASMAFPFSNETEEEMKKKFLEEAEQAAREGRKWGDMPKAAMERAYAE